jgi:hypothetical protein
MSRQQTAGQNHNIKTGTESFGNMKNFKYPGMTVRNQNCIREVIKRRLNLEMLATMQFRIFCLLMPSTKAKK